MRITSPFILISIFLLLTSLSTLANNQALPLKTIAESAEQVRPLLNGQYIPSNITVTTSTGKKLALTKVINNQKTILFFYRGGWCPFCNTQMGQLKQIESQLSSLGFQLIGISTDNAQDLQKSIGKNKLNYQLLADFNSDVSQAFGLAYYASKETTDRYLKAINLKNPLQKNQAGEERLVLPVPAIYVIDSDGLVQFNYVNPNYKVRLHQSLLLKAAALVK
ncbi:peroxiredoxin-like family protein [Colwellia sp. KU-HH00111]|uniref:peroxiredoxin-like family protein n=1 Tax=Colwellia sp. KU-HH00111 TaxID=3127652 RepID=UPI0031071854